MTVAFDCPRCNGRIEADPAVDDGRAQCPHCENVVLIPAAGIEPGAVLAGYRIERRLGTGGMGEVFLATQLAMDRQVALKVLAPAMTRNRTLLDRFLHEIRMAARLEHPNVVTAFDAGSHGGYHYLAMSYVDGEDIHDRLDRLGHLSEHEALEVVDKVAGALSYAWQKHHMLHRDIKPANIMIDRTGDVKLMDLGIAKTMEEDSRLTRVGMFVGTPDYMSPEQAKAEQDVDFRADIYSLGATLYHMLTGEPPFKASTAVSVLSKHLSEAVPSPQAINPDISDMTVHMVNLMMAKKRDRRYPSWDDVIEDTRLILSQDPRTLQLAVPKQILQADVDDESGGPPQTLTAAFRATITAPTTALTAAGDTPKPASPEPSSNASAPLAPPGMERWGRVVGVLLGLGILFLFAAGVRHLILSRQIVQREIKRGRQVKATESEREMVTEIESALLARQTRSEVEATASERQQRLAEMVSYAQTYAREHPDRWHQALQNYRKIRDYARETKYELMVDAEIQRLEEALEQAPSRVLETLGREAEPLLAAFDYRAAARLFTSYDGPLAPLTVETRRERADALLAKAAQVEQAVSRINDVLPALQRLDLEELNRNLDDAAADPTLAGNPFFGPVAAGLLDVRRTGHAFFQSFRAQIGRKVHLSLQGTDGRTREVVTTIDAVDESALVIAGADGAHRLHADDFSHREYLLRDKQYGLTLDPVFKGLLAQRAGLDDVAAEQYAKAPAGLLPLRLAGTVQERLFIGTWESTEGAHQLQLTVTDDGRFRLVIGQRQAHRGSCYVMAGRLHFLTSSPRRHDSWGFARDAVGFQLTPVPGTTIPLTRKKP